MHVLNQTPVRNIFKTLKDLQKFKGSSVVHIGKHLSFWFNYLSKYMILKVNTQPVKGENWLNSLWAMVYDMK